MSGALSRVLVEILHESTAATPRPVLLSDLDDVAIRSLGAAAEHHGITPAVHRVLGASPELPPGVAGVVQEAYHRHCQLHLRALGDLRELVALLDGLDVPWAVVKGPVLVEHIYRGRDVRSYTDLDLFVDRASLAGVLSALESSGAVLLDRNWTLIRRQVRGELSLALGHGTVLDLHWHPFNDQRVRRAFSVSMPTLLERSRRVRISGAATSTLDATDSLIYLAAHAGLAGGYRLIWCKDLEQAVRNDPPDWDELVRRARTSGLALLVATMLGRAGRVVGAPVPPDVLAALAPAGWRNVIAVADRLSPPQRSFGHGLTARSAVAATRRTGLASLTELSRVLWADLVRPVLTDPGDPRRRRLLGHPPLEERLNPLAEPCGDPEDRRAYMRLIAGDRAEP